MALPVYPPTISNSSPSFLTYDRGTTAYFFTNRQTVSTQSAVAGYGNSLGIPNGSTVYAIPNSKSVEGATQDEMIQIDAYGASSTQGPSAVVAVFGSLDGVQFYNLATLATVTTQGALFSLAKLVTPGIKPKYLTCGVTVYGGVGGTTDSVTASMFA
jgi:hypothetical protein